MKDIQSPAPACCPCEIIFLTTLRQPKLKKSVLCDSYPGIE